MANQLLYATVSTMITSLGFTKKLAGRLSDTIQRSLKEYASNTSITKCDIIKNNQFVVYFRNPQQEPIKVTIEDYEYIRNKLPQTR